VGVTAKPSRTVSHGGLVLKKLNIKYQNEKLKGFVISNF
jgi:hypothetical protein